MMCSPIGGFAPHPPRLRRDRIFTSCHVIAHNLNRTGVYRYTPDESKPHSRTMLLEA